MASRYFQIRSMRCHINAKKKTNNIVASNLVVFIYLFSVLCVCVFFLFCLVLFGHCVLHCATLAATTNYTILCSTAAAAVECKLCVFLNTFARACIAQSDNKRTKCIARQLNEPASTLSGRHGCILRVRKKRTEYTERGTAAHRLAPKARTLQHMCECVCCAGHNLTLHINGPIYFTHNITANIVFFYTEKN